MKTVPLIICAAILCQTQSSVLTKPNEIKTYEGATITLTCVDDNITRLAPPPGCIVQNDMCQIYHEPYKYLSRGSVIIKTYSDTTSSENHSIKYITGPLRGVLSMTVSEIRAHDAGLYRCGIITPAGLHLYTEYMITVSILGWTFPIEISPPLSFTKTAVRGVSTDRINVTKVVGVVGKNIRVEGLFKPLQIKKPDSSCIQDYRKCQSFFQPLLYLKQNVCPEFILRTDQDYAENGKYSLKYEQSSVTVGITGLTKADTGRYICGVEAPSGDTFSTMFEIFVEDGVPEAPSRWLLLLLLIPVLLLTAGGMYLIFYKKRKSNLDSPKTDTSGGIDAEVAVYENCPAPPSEPKDHTYQSLSADTRDDTHIYVIPQLPFH